MKVVATRPEPELAAPPAPAFVALVVAAQAGDRAAFARLYDQFEPTVRGIALARVSPADARDVLHDVFVTVLTRLPSLRAPLAFPTWLASIARNRSIDASYHPSHHAERRNISSGGGKNRISAMRWRDGCKDGSTGTQSSRSLRSSPKASDDDFSDGQTSKAIWLKWPFPWLADGLGNSIFPSEPNHGAGRHKSAKAAGPEGRALWTTSIHKRNEPCTNSCALRQ